jgi:SAM-dependent methyltransferase
VSRFDPESYALHRIEYPRELFAPLSSFVFRSKESFHLIDLGAGTGLATRSFLRFFSGVDCVTLIDPDSAMLDVAGDLGLSETVRFSSAVGFAESFFVPEPADLILVGSAWHWMNPEKAMDAIQRALKPGGAVFVFEYQFPKVREGDAGRINEWVRRSFNLTWRETDQKPRGSLDQTLSSFFGHPDFSYRGEAKVAQDFELTVDELFGVIVSQSRYLAYERMHAREERASLRQRVFQDLCGVWGGSERMIFSYRFHGVRFQNRSV